MHGRVLRKDTLSKSDSPHLPWLTCDYHGCYCAGWDYTWVGPLQDLSELLDAVDGIDDDDFTEMQHVDMEYDSASAYESAKKNLWWKLEAELSDSLHFSQGDYY